MSPSTRAKIRTQPATRGRLRSRVSSAVSARIERAIAREQARFGVSRSFVIAVALSYTFKIELDEGEDYHE